MMFHDMMAITAIISLYDVFMMFSSARVMGMVRKLREKKRPSHRALLRRPHGIRSAIGGSMVHLRQRIHHLGGIPTNIWVLYFHI